MQTKIISSHKIFMLLFVMLCMIKQSAWAQQATPVNQRKEVLQSRSVQETNLMKERYGLTPDQLAKITKINAAFYAGIHDQMEKEKNPALGKERIMRLSEGRDKELKEIFTSEQYAAYRKDIDAMASRVSKQ